MINEVNYEHAKSFAAKMDEIIKEAAEQGWKYLIIKRETKYAGNTAIMTVRWTGRDDVVGIDPEIYEIYELDKVREYLNGIVSTEQPSE